MFPFDSPSSVHAAFLRRNKSSEPQGTSAGPKNEASVQHLLAIIVLLWKFNASWFYMYNIAEHVRFNVTVSREALCNHLHCDSDLKLVSLQFGWVAFSFVFVSFPASPTAVY